MDEILLSKKRSDLMLVGKSCPPPGMRFEGNGGIGGGGGGGIGGASGGGGGRGGTFGLVPDVLLV